MEEVLLHLKTNEHYQNYKDGDDDWCWCLCCLSCDDSPFLSAHDKRQTPLHTLLVSPLHPAPPLSTIPISIVLVRHGPHHHQQQNKQNARHHRRRPPPHHHHHQQPCHHHDRQSHRGHLGFKHLCETPTSMYRGPSSRAGALGIVPVAQPPPSLQLRGELSDVRQVLHGTSFR